MSQFLCRVSLIPRSIVLLRVSERILMGSKTRRCRSHLQIGESDVTR